MLNSEEVSACKFNCEYNGTVYLELIPCMNYAMLLNKIDALKSLRIFNSDVFEWKEVRIEITGDYIKKYEYVIDEIDPDQCVDVDSIKIDINANKLLELTEGIDNTIKLSLSIEKKVVLENDYPIRLMAYDQWSGVSIYPELLSTFVTPNNPMLSRISVKASGFLEKFTGDSELDEYQTQDPNRVRKQIAAVYEALRSESLVYAAPPASFEECGQRVRLVDKVLTEKLGTCLDLTLLFASCLESIGIHPILVLLKKHIFLGAWLTTDMYSHVVSDDASFLLKGCADGINDIVLVESTALTSSKNLSFEDAVQIAESELKNEDNFELFIDVFRCRFDNIKPLPQRNKIDGIWKIENDGVKHENVTVGVNQLTRFDINCDLSNKVITKQMLWERKLLDMSLRNNLINMRLGRRVIPFISFDIDHLEDNLQAGEVYKILPTPLVGKTEPNQYGIYNSSTLKTELEALVVKKLQNKTIYSYLKDAELQDALKYVYRTSRTSLEENGANSLFLTLGLLKWYETEKSVRPRFAPILLLPVDIIRHGGIAGYEIKTRDEDIILNITLVEMLKQQFGIILTGLDPLPKDYSGVDVKLIFSIIRTFIRSKKGWDVLEESLLGLFSFNKFVMWNDIHNNAEELRENKIVESLMDNQLKLDNIESYVDARTIDKENAPSDFAVPVNVDSSQMEAVVESGNGKSFILYGPPGTGKSQTITNMIANALYQGKKVLFVAEKMAALSVVQNRLAKIGLDPFCLELHSNKATKAHFLEQLQKSMDVTRIQSSEAFEKKSTELFERRKKLIEYMEALHRKHSFGYSLYDCIINYLYIDGDELTLDLSKLNNINIDWLSNIKENMIEIDTVFRITSHPQDNPLKGLYPIIFLSDNFESLRLLLEKLQSSFVEITKIKKFFANRFSLTALQDNIDGYILVKNICNSLLKLNILNNGLLRIVGNKEMQQDLRNIVECGKERDEVKKILLNEYKQEILDLNAFELQKKWMGICNKWLLPRFIGKRSFIKRLCFYDASFDETKIDKLLNDLERYQRQDKAVKEHSDELINIFGNLCKKDHEKWDDVCSTLDNASDLYNNLLVYSQTYGILLSEILSDFLKNTGDDWYLFKQSFDKEFRNFDKIIVDFIEEWNNIKTICVIDCNKDDFSLELIPSLDKWINNFSGIKEWYQWCMVRDSLEKQNLLSIVKYIEDNHKTGLEAYNALFKGVNHEMAMNIVNSDKSLQLFNGLLFQEMINKYRDLTTEFQELTKKELIARLAAKIPSLTMEAAQSSEVGILKRNITNGGRGTSIRKIIDQIPNLLTKLCPCMLMSPMSVAQFIDINSDKFDIVIFDEASQMPTSEAVGAIARGKSLVVVGDPKQMPPTSFFSSAQVDEEEAEIDDMESILDDCISLSMPPHYLSWHYRSKHESLITFSNMNYYEGKLTTFPSVDDRTSKVSLIHIDGVYDKGHTRSNREEALAIVKEIICRLKNPDTSNKSIGVVSFSKVQQNLIEDLLTEELGSYPELEEKAFQCDEPIFVKNLENVQGDERDVILFSIGYGPDKNGYVSMNFGPLNNKGGERRLNVAVSRARYEMIIFSTLRAEQIDLKRTKSKGVEGLKHFLEFAESGFVKVPSSTFSSKSQHSLVTLIAYEIEQMGYNVDTFVGHSNFRIDLAVRDPKGADLYILGILCDGESYYKTKTTRDREIVQPEVLSMLNWTIMRVWSVDWYENKQEVIKRIKEKLTEIKENRNENPRSILVNKSLNSSFTFKDEPIIDAVNERCKKYVFCDLPFIDNSGIDAALASPYIVEDQLRRIISIEQPITNTLIYKMIAHAWKIGRVTSRLQTMVDNLLCQYYKDPLSDKTKFYWENVDKSINYKYYRTDSNRDIQDIPILEVMNATLYIIEQQMAMPSNDLKRLTSQVLGFNRKGVNLDVATNNSIKILLSQGMLNDNYGIISFCG